MKLRIRAAVCGLLSVCAAYTAAKAVGSISRRAEAASEPVYTYEWGCEENEAEYVLRDWDGYVGVFSGGETRDPVTVTDIEVATLRGADQAMLQNGIFVADREELLGLLEDFGS